MSKRHPDFFRNNLVQQIKEEFPEGKAVEIGTFKGSFSNVILSNWEGTLYMVDPWRALGAEYIDASNHYYHQEAYSETMSNIRGMEERGIMIRALSNQAVELFPNESLDFIYIDANHAYDYVKEDMEIWWPKLKRGGYFAGHDYLGLENWYETEFIGDKGKDKHIWMKGPESNEELVYSGIFGVNTAVDEFAMLWGVEVNLTDSWLGTWWFKKP